MSAIASPAIPTVAPPPPLRAQSKRLRVLMTLDAVGGVWRYAMELARGLKSQRVEIVFAGMGPPPGPEQRAEALELGTLEWLDAPLDWMSGGEGEFDAVSPALRGLVRSHGIDVAHLNLPSQAPLLAGEAPIVVVSHSCVPTWWAAVKRQPVPEPWRWHWRANRRGFDLADTVIAPSAAHADQLVSCYGPLSRLEVVHNAIGGLLHGRPKRDAIFAAGRWWDEGKNAALLEQIAGALSWPILLAGPLVAPDGQTFTPRRTRALGPLPHRQVLEHVATAGVLVSPSLYEPFGLAALEGARSGAALALADIPTYRELWRDAALLFDPRDARSLTHTLHRLTVDAGLRRDLGDRALAASRRFTPDRQSRRMLEIYAAIARTPAAIEREEV